MTTSSLSQALQISLNRVRISSATSISVPGKYEVSLLRFIRARVMHPAVRTSRLQFFDADIAQLEQTLFAVNVVHNVKILRKCLQMSDQLRDSDGLNGIHD